ncbi:hypothetical protein [Pseudoalteromonas aurantia]|uniref:Uncharacterized protein n=1 Tax=Pseudoalteromonas aurantia TaxID=43654 RepID=A0A5S3V1D9_9GAMM|nr:hypothetical protein [Pseudoalteromonas aurantia]TMO63758.1 hypothetical protein CWC19_18950 [Pseudoalteromonas aurantia]TMO73697.1 hypothetical protein CWC20_12605 [Pseudoalteromonas aurantia]
MLKIKAALEKLDDAMIDFSTLSVATYTGDISVILKADDGASIKLNELDFNDVLQKAISGASASTDGNIELVALNTHKLDGDGMVFRQKDISPELETAHNAALSAARETREGLLALVKDVF